jgi:predicted O-methyltransferase YrrM
MTPAAAQEHPLQAEIEGLVNDVPGWSPIDELCALATLVHDVEDVRGDIVEVGSWCGRSTIVLAYAARRIGGPTVHAVDLFPHRHDWYENTDGSRSFDVALDGGHHAGNVENPVWADTFEAQLAPIYATCGSTFEIFDRVLRDRGLETGVAVHRGTSETFAASAGARFRCRLAFIDADHGYHAVKRDIAAITPLLSAGAWLCFDDAFSAYEGVTRAIEEDVVGSPLFVDGRQLTRKLFVARRSGRPAPR